MDRVFQLRQPSRKRTSSSRHFSMYNYPSEARQRSPLFAQSEICTEENAARQAHRRRASMNHPRISPPPYHSFHRGASDHCFSGGYPQSPSSRPGTTSRAGFPTNVLTDSPIDSPRVDILQFEYNNQPNRGVTHYDYRDYTSFGDQTDDFWVGHHKHYLVGREGTSSAEGTAAESAPAQASSCPGNSDGNTDDDTKRDQNTPPTESTTYSTVLLPFQRAIIFPGSASTNPIQNSTGSFVVYDSPPNLDPEVVVHRATAAARRNSSKMAGSRIPTSASKTKPSQAQASRVPRPIPDPSSAYAALESRENSIRLVKPDYTQPLPQRPIDKYITKKDATDDGVLHSQVEKGESSTMHDDKEQGQKAKNIAEGSHGRSKTECPPSVKKSESLGRTRDRSVGQSMSKVDISTQKDKIQDGLAESGHRRHRYEFIDSDESSLTSSPDTNTETDDKAKVDKGKKIDSSERESSMTTMTELMTRAIESPPPQLPLRQQQQQEPAGVDVNALAPQPSQPRHLPRRRPIPLDLRSPAYLGMVSRHTRRYEVEHIAIESSRAEHFDLAGPSSSVYDDHDHGPPPSSPIRVPECVQDGVTGLALYDVWRDTQPPLRSSSQGSINITIPNEEDGFSERRNIRGNRQHDAGYHIGEPLAINRVRSRSALGIRERRNREGRYNFSGESVPVAHEYVPEFQGPGILRSATMNDVNRGRQFTDSSEPTVYRSNNVPSQMDDPPSPFTPLTPFIMRLTGAPAGVEGGAKKLIGEHGWLEDTAASGPKHSQVEKPIGFMGSLRRMAREFADTSAFKPARPTRATPVNRIKISLDAREQSLLYCELEYNLNNALDAYIKLQLNSGRLEPSKLSRVAEAWASKGRPKVVGFRYDLETQVALIAVHMNEFRFYGPLQAEGPAAMTGLFHAMKMNARCMRVRTFCQPDSVIAKHILDAQNFLRLLGSLESFQRPLEEVAQFFKVAVDRHRVMAEAPASREDGDLIISNDDNRVVSHGSTQRVRFQDEEGEQRRRYANMPSASGDRDQQRQFSEGSEGTQRLGTARNYSRHH